MKILFLSPQPFFQERGTPIAVKLALETLGQRKDLEIDLLTYKEGQSIDLTNVKHIRAPIPSIFSNISPGLTLKKLFCDLIFFFSVLKLNIFSKKKYDVIHAVEESVFMAWLVKKVKKTPYIYDMDSNLVDQSITTWKLLKYLKTILAYFEKIVLKNSLVTVPVCDALADQAKKLGAKNVKILRDISYFDPSQGISTDKDIKKQIGLDQNSKLIIYIGNLEPYQGIDLLIDSFQLAKDTNENFHLVIIGGSKETITKYKSKVEQLKLSNQCHLVGTRPISDLSCYLKQADILASPRTEGQNTPLKIYSYLHSGVAILATNLPTHTQVMNTQTAQLAEATVSDYSEKMKELILDPGKRKQIGQAARKLAEENYTLEVYQKSLNAIYDKLHTL